MWMYDCQTSSVRVCVCVCVCVRLCVRVGVFVFWCLFLSFPSCFSVCEKTKNMKNEADGRMGPVITRHGVCLCVRACVCLSVCLCICVCVRVWVRMCERKKTLKK